MADSHATTAPEHSTDAESTALNSQIHVQSTPLNAFNSDNDDNDSDNEQAPPLPPRDYCTEDMANSLNHLLRSAVEEMDARVLSTRDSQLGLFRELERLHAGIVHAPIHPD